MLHSRREWAEHRIDLASARRDRLVAQRDALLNHHERSGSHSENRRNPKKPKTTSDHGGVREVVHNLERLNADQPSPDAKAEVARIDAQLKETDLELAELNRELDDLLEGGFGSFRFPGLISSVFTLVRVLSFVCDFVNIIWSSVFAHFVRSFRSLVGIEFGVCLDLMSRDIEISARACVEKLLHAWSLVYVCFF